MKFDLFDRRPLVVILVLVVFFFWKLSLSQQFTFADNPDLAYQVLPWYEVQAQAWHEGVFPMWDPYHWAGQSLLGQMQPGGAFPLNWPLFLAPLKNGHKWGIHLTQVAPRRCGLVDPWTPAHCTQNAPWGARRRSAGNWATRLRFGPIKDYARAMAIAGLETWCYRQAFPGAANGQPQYVVVT